MKILQLWSLLNNSRVYRQVSRVVVKTIWILMAGMLNGKTVVDRHRCRSLKVKWEDHVSLLALLLISSSNNKRKWAN